MQPLTRAMYLPFALPDLDDSEFELVRDSLRSGWITTGPQTRQFEAEFAAAVGGSHAIAVNSCTAAMHLALEAIGLQSEDEVITTPYTFAATAEVIRYFGARPVFVDINADDFNINVSQIEAAVTPRTKAIIPVHIAGLAADLDAIDAIAARYNLAVIEDAAHSFPTRYHGRMIGENSNAEVPLHVVCFSFYATKTITTGEGGMIVTDDEAIADRCRIMALHGISKDAWKRYTKEGSWYYEIIAPGYKYNMTDVAAAMGRAQLAKAERMWQRRQTIAQAYSAAFSSVPSLEVPVGPEYDEQVSCRANTIAQETAMCTHAWHLYMLRIRPERLSIDRDTFIEELKLRKIGVSVHFIPLHIHPYYRNTFGYQPNDFPVAYREFAREISLPIYSKMNDQDVQDVIGAVLDIVQRYGC